MSKRELQSLLLAAPPKKRFKSENGSNSSSSSSSEDEEKISNNMELVETTIVHSESRDEALVIMRSSWEFIQIYNFLCLFRAQFSLPKTNFFSEDLENLFLSRNEDGLLVEIIMKLLKGLRFKGVNRSNWKKYLSEFGDLLVVEYEIFDENPLKDGNNFWALPMKSKILIIQELCQCQMEDNEDIKTQLKSDEKGNNLDNYRVDPLGCDSNNYSYYYFEDSRLYREKLSSKGKPINDTWEMVCSQLDEWEDFCSNLAKSKYSEDRKFARMLTEDILPFVTTKIQSKQRAERRAERRHQTMLFEPVPLKRSTRLQEKELRKQEENKLKAEKLKQQQQLERERLHQRRSTRLHNDHPIDEKALAALSNSVHTRASRFQKRQEKRQEMLKETTNSEKLEEQVTNDEVNDKLDEAIPSNEMNEKPKEEQIMNNHEKLEKQIINDQTFKEEVINNQKTQQVNENLAKNIQPSLKELTNNGQTILQQTTNNNA